MMKEKWFIQSKRADFNEIAKKFNISPIIARIIRNRDVIGDDAINQYLNSDINTLSSPWLFKDMDKAVDILKIKIAGGNPIRVISDYDADGVCSGYILHTALTRLGAVVDVDIPHRVQDGYGINNRLVEKAHEDGIDTIITCDNGIAAAEQVELAKSLGMTVIITDHHEVPFDLVDGEKQYIVPKADAIINHKQIDCEYPFKDFCGAMVAYQTMSALFEAMNRHKNEIADLIMYAAIATVTDIMNLTGENRVVVKHGISLVKKTKDVGLSALIEANRIERDNISSYSFGFIIGPCINASGRLQSAKDAINLLMEKNPEKARDMAKKLVEINNERKDQTELGKEKAIEIAADMEEKVLVIYLPDCHESIAGIIAGKVKETYYKPTIVLTDSEDGIKGSARSIETYNIHEELTKVKDLLTHFGGHPMAAGLSLKKENIDLLRERLNANCNLTEEDLYLKVWIDMQLPFEYVTMNLIEELDVLEPKGKGNEKPVFAQKDLKIKSLKIQGKHGNVIKMTVEDIYGMRITAVMFNRVMDFMAMLKERFGQSEIDKAMKGVDNNMTFMATFYPNINEFNGKTTLQIIIDRFC